jgi:hypothetical protein
MPRKGLARGSGVELYVLMHSGVNCGWVTTIRKKLQISWDYFFFLFIRLALNTLLR